jgi:integrase
MIRTRHPGIYKRGARYVFTWRDANGRQRKRSAATMAEAIAKRGDEIGRAHRGERVGNTHITFVDYAIEWATTYTGRTRRGISANTLDDYRAALGLDADAKPVDPPRGAIAFFGRKRLAEIGPRDLRAYAAHVASRGVARNTVRLALSPVKAMLATAVEDEILTANPAAGLPNLIPTSTARPAAEHVRALSAEELHAVLDHVSEHWVLFFEFLAETGLRIGEAIEVRWGDIDNLDLDIGPRLLHVRRRLYRGTVAAPKGGKTRTVRLTTEMARALRAMRDEVDAQDDDLVFTAARGGRIVPANLMRRVLKAAAVEAGLGRWVVTPRGRQPQTWVGFHTFRHTCATILIVDEGWSLERFRSISATRTT